MDLKAQTELLGYIIYSGAAGLICIGLYAMVVKRHLIRILMGLTLVEAGVNLSLVASGFRSDAVAPIFSDESVSGHSMVDPVPQALILTAIVIGVGVLALALALMLQVQRHYGTLDSRELAERLAADSQPEVEAGSRAEGVDIEEGEITRAGRIS